jgi:tetratricopeptide (TPR) repeat protein
MSPRKFISRFTPSRTDPAALEEIFVQRHDLLDDAVARVRESATTGNKHHLLFVGPRGSGKTNLVTLLFHRIDQQADLRDRLRIAWLNEDETSTTFLDLLLRIYRALGKKYPAEFPLAALDPLYELAQPAAADRLGELLLSQLGPRPLLVLVENLNELFDSLGDDGQKSWRAFLQNHPVFTLVATAQRLFDGVTRRTSPFFGFFQTEHLRPLTVSEAIGLLEKIAALNADRELGDYLRSRVGRARVRALHHLTGGNHRIYVVLSEFITRESIDQLVGPFESMIDALTPYYQERIRWLAPLQRKIVEHLCSRARPTPVKDIAKALFATHQTIASQLKALREIGYVESHPRGRESLYELSEPLMRLCVEVKENQQRKPLRLIVDFLRVWYDADKLESHLAALSAEAPERAYVIQALELLRAQTTSPRVEYLLDDLSRTNPQTPSPERLQCLRELIEERGSEDDWCDLVLSLFSHEKWEELVETVKQGRAKKAIETEAARNTLSFYAAFAFLKLGRPADAIPNYSDLVDRANLTAELRRKTSALRGALFLGSGELDKAAADFKSVIDAPESEPEARIFSLQNHAALLMAKSQWPEAFRSLAHALQISPHAFTPDSTPLATMISVIFRSALSDAGWRPRIAEFIQLFTEHISLSALGNSLVKSIPKLNKSNLNETGLDAWVALWRELGAPHDELTVPLRLLETGVAFIKTKDEGVLLNLPKEERSILRQTLGLPPETAAP